MQAKVVETLLFLGSHPIGSTLIHLVKTIGIPLQSLWGGLVVLYGGEEGQQP